MANDPGSRGDHEDDAPRLKVNDRRAFTRDGERRAEDGDADAPPAEAVPEGPAAAAVPEAPPAASPDSAPGGEPEPSIDFVAFVQSLYLSAMMSLGEVENPYTRQFEANLDLARQNIDILTMLAEKTRGNLDQEEQGLIDQVVPHLQLLYVKKAG